jgi:peptidoglycan/LPS O-acetylase OafA/YrhL
MKDAFVGPESPAERTSPIDRVVELDGVRGLAILLVLVHHYCRDLPAAGWVDRLVLTGASIGWIGVDLFFLLSGYLITGILLDAKTSPGFLLAFYARRTLRIFPPYYLLLFFLFCLVPALGVSLVGESSRDSVWFWLYGSNFLIAVQDWPHRVLAPLWSLAVEQHFYLIWPLVILAVPGRHLAGVTVLIALGSAFLRFVGLTLGWNTSAIYVLTFTRLDALAVGGLLATATRSGAVSPMRLSRIGAVVGLGGLLTGLVATSLGRGHWGAWNETELVSGFLVLAVGLWGGLGWLLSIDYGHRVRALFRLPALTIVGRRSYAMYLWHMPFIEVASRLGLDPASHVRPGLPIWPYLLVYVPSQTALLFVAAQISWRFVEGPLLGVKDRIPYR